MAFAMLHKTLTKKNAVQCKLFKMEKFHGFYGLSGSCDKTFPVI